MQRPSGSSDGGALFRTTRTLLLTTKKADALPLLGVFGNSLIAGFLVGVSCVGAATAFALLEHNLQTFQIFFRTWWPLGKRFMMPLLASTVLVQGANYWITGNILFLLAAGCTASIGVFTKVGWPRAARRA